MWDYSQSLNPEKALIWRIVHRDNVPWILDNGLLAGNSKLQSPDWVHIGNPELTEKRARHPVQLGPGGSLNDYVPFYFTPFSPMLKNIHSGWGGIERRPNEDIVILVSSLRKVEKMGLPFVFTDSHAYYKWADFYTDLVDLGEIDWSIIQRRDFKRDENDPGKFERYQAEALVFELCPIDALEGIVCYSEPVKQQVENWAKSAGVSVNVIARKNWYFS